MERYNVSADPFSFPNTVAPLEGSLSIRFAELKRQHVLRVQLPPKWSAIRVKSLDFVVTVLGLQCL